MKLDSRGQRVTLVNLGYQGSKGFPETTEFQEKLELLEDLDKMVSQAGKEKGERLEIPFLESRDEMVDLEVMVSLD